MVLEIAKNGYSQEQVDAYIKMFSEKYEEMQQEYAALLEKNRALTAALDETNSNAQRMSALYKQTVKTLIDAEILAKQIMERAHLEAGQILSSAKAELEKTVTTRDSIINEPGDIRKLSDDEKLSPFFEKSQQYKLKQEDLP